MPEPTDVDLHIGKRLRAMRRGARLTQQEVGCAIGVSFQTVQKYECAGARLSASRLYAIAQVLGRPTAEFFPGGM